MYQIEKTVNRIKPLTIKKFADLDFHEREHLQEWLANEPKALGEDLLIIRRQSGQLAGDDRLAGRAHHQTRSRLQEAVGGCHPGAQEVRDRVRDRFYGVDCDLLRGQCLTADWLSVREVERALAVFL